MASKKKTAPVEAVEQPITLPPPDAERIARLERAVRLLIEYGANGLGPQGTARLLAALHD